MSEEKKDSKENPTDEEVERILDHTWENWSSRRQCEQKHTPEYIKRAKNKKELN